MGLRGRGALASLGVGHCSMKTLEIVHPGNNPRSSQIYFCYNFLTGKGKGTPALKNGIRCLGIDVDMDSEANSDWQGFD